MQITTNTELTSAAAVLITHSPNNGQLRLPEAVYSGQFSANNAKLGNAAGIIGITDGANNSIRIGDVPDRTWIPGLFPDGTITPSPWKVVPQVPYEPYQPYDPFPEIQPYDVPYNPTVITTHTSGFLQALYWWRIDSVDDKSIKLSCDMPGVKISDLDVSIEAMVIKAVGTRTDTKEKVERSYIIDQKYDPESAEALLEDGVLRVSFKVYPHKLSRKIKVNAR